MVTCFPVKIERASAGWTRAVAILDVKRLEHHHVMGGNRRQALLLDCQSPRIFQCFVICAPTSWACLRFLRFRPRDRRKTHLPRCRHPQHTRHPDRAGSGNGAQQFGQRPQRFWQCGQNAAASAAGNGPAGSLERPCGKQPRLGEIVGDGHFPARTGRVARSAGEGGGARAGAPARQEFHQHLPRVLTTGRKNFCD